MVFLIRSSSGLSLFATFQSEPDLSDISRRQNSPAAPGLTACTAGDDLKN
jgi:hypothetical protein